MILEIADFRILPGQQDAFEIAIRKGMAEVLSHASHPIEFVGPLLEDEALAVHQG